MVELLEHLMAKKTDTNVQIIDIMNPNTKTAPQISSEIPRNNLKSAVKRTIRIVIDNENGVSHPLTLFNLFKCFNNIFSSLSSVISIKSDFVFVLT